MYSRVLIPLDGKLSSEAVLPHVKRLAHGTETEMVLLHVVLSPAPELAIPSRPLVKDRVSNRREKFVKYLKKTCGVLEKDGGRATYLIREGGVAETILEVADFMQIDLIAMSTQGRSPAQILLLGNVTYQVVRHSPLPMLVVRSKPKFVHRRPQTPKPV
jgi:nucleotide-binding universal stress UspA family protein